MWWQPSNPSADIKPLPWLAPDVIVYLENIIQPDFRVFEHGSGGSTLWFADRVESVWTYEKNINWFHTIKKIAPPNVEIFSYFNLAEYFGSNFDLLLIDGEPIETRGQWITDAPSLVKPGGWIVLDNANRPEYAQERAWLGTVAELVKRFDGNQGVTKYLVTEFYKWHA